MHGKLVPRHVLLLQQSGVRNGARADNEEGGREIFLVQILEKTRGVGGGAIIVRQAPGELVRARDDVSVARAATAGPPATARVGNCLRVGGTSAGLRDRDIGDGDTRVLNFLDPLLYLRRVGWRGLVKRRIVGRVDANN